MILSFQKYDCIPNAEIKLHTPPLSSLLFFFFYQDSVEYCIIGVTILSQLTNEINQVSATAFLIEVSAIFFLSIGVFCSVWDDLFWQLCAFAVSD